MWESYQYSRAKTMRHELLASWLHQFDWTLDLVFDQSRAYMSNFPWGCKIDDLVDLRIVDLEYL